MYYLTHINFVIQDRCYQLDDQVIVWGVRMLSVTKEKSATSWEWNHMAWHGHFFLQAKTLHCSTRH